MNPYLTPASEPRARSIAHEDVALRAAWFADWATECGNLDEAVAAHRRSAHTYLRAAELRAEAASLRGGQELDERCVGWHRAAAERANAEADRLLYGAVSV